MNIGDRVVKDLVAAHRFGIRKKMSEQKKSEWHDAGYLMQFSQQKSIADFHLCFLIFW